MSLYATLAILIGVFFFFFVSSTTDTGPSMILILIPSSFFRADSWQRKSKVWGQCLASEGRRERDTKVRIRFERKSQEEKGKKERESS